MNTLDTLSWVLLFGGLVLYWLKKADEVRITHKGKTTRAIIHLFFKDNFFEFPTSALSCLLLALLADKIPTEIIDLKGYLSLLLIGFGGGSAINGLITKIKK